MRSLRVMAALSLVGVTAAPALAAPQPVKAAVLRSQGTQFLGMTIWNDLNNGWSQFGDVPVQIDYTSLAGYDWTVGDIAATGADVLILSAPGYLGYSDAEIDAIIQYVEAGHGIIYTYGLFRGNQSRLAPLVGLSASNVLGTGVADSSFTVVPSVFDHPLFAHVTLPYVSGVRALASPWSWWKDPWLLDGGEALATIPAFNNPPGPDVAIVAKQSDGYRGLYFSYYIENRAGGSNRQDMQVFYNALLWTPEPATLLFVLTGASLFLRRKRRR